MLGRMRKLVAVGFVGGLMTWWLRLLAHSKEPPPEGRWKELFLDQDR